MEWSRRKLYAKSTKVKHILTYSCFANTILFLADIIICHIPKLEVWEYMVYYYFDG